MSSPPEFKAHVAFGALKGEQTVSAAVSEGPLLDDREAKFGTMYGV